MIENTPLTRRSAVLTCLLSAITVALCAAMLGAAVLAPAPPVVVPFVVLVGVGLPLVAAWDLPQAVAVLRDRPLPGSHAAQVVAQFRRELDLLPETRRRGA